MCVCVCVCVNVCVCVCERVRACVDACVCMPISSMLWVEMSKFELVWHESSNSSGKFNSTVEKGMTLTLSGIKVPTLQISSIP